MENPIAETATTGHNILNFKAKPQAKSVETGLSNRAYGIAVVTEVNGTQPVSVTLNDTRYPVTHYLSTLPGIVPSVKLGDEVLISTVAGEDGVMLHGIAMDYADTPTGSSISMQDGKLVIEAQGAVILKCGASTLELTETGEIRLNGRDVRTVADSVRTEGKDIRTIAKKKLTLQGSKIDLN